MLSPVLTGFSFSTVYTERGVELDTGFDEMDKTEKRTQRNSSPKMLKKIKSLI